jgi:exosortase D (VPLPA-CTERM-specific)
MWKRVTLVLSSVPISIVLNGFRIGMIGVLVEWYGQGAAEGFYHLFEGWVLFMASLGLLILEMGVLARIGTTADRSSMFRRFTWTGPLPEPRRGIPHYSSSSYRQLPSPAYLCGVALLIPMAFTSTLIADHEDISPPRAMFVDFPMQLDGWLGTSLTLEKQFIDTLRLDDYVLADYRFGEGQPVNFYTAYYRSQRKGQSAHSPQSCLPGGGWEISSLTHMDLPASSRMVRSLPVNRALIQKDTQKQIVFYWFKQRDRLLNDEYLVKLFLFWDALSRGRTDGALVRIASLVGPGETEDIVDQRLLRFVSTIEPELNRYVPD